MTRQPRITDRSDGARLCARSTSRSTLGWPIAQKSCSLASIFKFLRLASEAQSRSKRVAPMHSRPADHDPLSPREWAGVRGKSPLNLPTRKLLCKFQSTLRPSLPARNEWGESRREGRLTKNVPLLHEPPVGNANVAKRGNYNQSANTFPPYGQSLPLPKGEGRGGGEGSVQSSAACSSPDHRVPASLLENHEI